MNLQVILHKTGPCRGLYQINIRSLHILIKKQKFFFDKPSYNYILTVRLHLDKHKHRNLKFKYNSLSQYILVVYSIILFNCFTEWSDNICFTLWHVVSLTTIISSWRQYMLWVDNIAASTGINCRRRKYV